MLKAPEPKAPAKPLSLERKSGEFMTENFILSES
jgi:hypothetical protein